MLKALKDNLKQVIITTLSELKYSKGDNLVVFFKVPLQVKIVWDVHEEHITQESYSRLNNIVVQVIMAVYNCSSGNVYN